MSKYLDPNHIRCSIGLELDPNSFQSRTTLCVLVAKVHNQQTKKSLLAGKELTIIVPATIHSVADPDEVHAPPPPPIKTRARSRWGTIANPDAKIFDSPQQPQVPPWQQNENSFQYVFYLLFVRTHTEFGIKIFEIDILMIFDLLTLSQSHQFDPRMKLQLAICSARHPRRLNMPHDHVWKKNGSTHWAPQVPLSPTPGA